MGVASGSGKWGGARGGKGLVVKETAKKGEMV